MAEKNRQVFYDSIKMLPLKTRGLEENSKQVFYNNIAS